MAAVTPVVYGLALKSLCEGRFDFRNHVMKAMLVGKGYTPNRNSHQWKNSVTHEIQASGYQPGGQALSDVQMNYSQKTLTVTAANLVWPSLTADNIRYIVVYDDFQQSDAAKPLLLYIDFGASQSPSTQSFYYNFPANVLFQQVIP